MHACMSVCMYVCMSVCMYVCMYTYMYGSIYTYIYIYIFDTVLGSSRDSNETFRDIPAGILKSHQNSLKDLQSEIPLSPTASYSERPTTVVRDDHLFGCL